MDLGKRINRIIGQLRGVEKMVNQKRDCSDILQQVSAIKCAIDGLSKEIAMTGISKYVTKSNSKKIEKLIDRAINL